MVKLVLDLSYGAASFVMPNLLSKVGADVLSINPYAQTPGMIAVDRHESEARVAEAVRGSGADLGAVIDAGGEHLTLIDDRGHVLSDDEALMVFLELTTAGGRDRTGRAAGHGQRPRAAAVRGARDRGDPHAALAVGLLEAAASGGVSFAADRRGGYIFPVFLPAFDAAAALATPDLAARAGHRLAGRSGRGHARPCRSCAREVATPLEQKGLVMRTLMEQLADEGADLVLVDGIKVISDDRLGAGGPGPRGPGHPRLGRGRPTSPRRRHWRRPTSSRMRQIHGSPQPTGLRVGSAVR